jgi:hypothetical protein
LSARAEKLKSKTNGTRIKSEKTDKGGLKPILDLGSVLD